MAQGLGWTADYAVERDTADYTALIQGGRRFVRRRAGHTALRVFGWLRACEPTRSPWAAAATMRASAMAADAESIGSPVGVSELQVYGRRAGRIYVLALKRKWSCLTPPVYRFRKPTD